jgi:hypothetical protein
MGDASWRLRKAAGLVKLLALAEGHRLHREQAMDLLWPDLAKNLPPITCVGPSTPPAGPSTRRVVPSTWHPRAGRSCCVEEDRCG